MTTFLVFKENSQGDLVYLVTLPSKDDGFTNAVAYWWEYATKEQRAGASLGIVGLVKLLKGDFVAENGVAVLSQFEKPDPSSKLLESYEFSEQLSEILVYENGAAAVLGDGSLLFFTQESDDTFTLVDPSLIPPFPSLINEIIGWPKDGYFEKLGGVL